MLHAPTFWQLAFAEHTVPSRLHAPMMAGHWALFWHDAPLDEQVPTSEQSDACVHAPPVVAQVPARVGQSVSRWQDVPV